MLEGSREFGEWQIGHLKEAWGNDLLMQKIWLHVLPALKKTSKREPHKIWKVENRKLVRYVNRLRRFMVWPFGRTS